jgi:transmembrane sensor
MKTFGPEVAAQSRDAISERAGYYFERRRFGEWSEADQAQLSAWLAESFLHRATYLRLEGAASYADHLAAVHTFKVAGSLTLPAKRQWKRLLIFPALVAASVALVAAVGVLYLHAPTEPPVRTFATNVGGRAALKFGDGTEIELNTDTAVRYRMTTDQRIVWLDRGEAYFRVAHDAANPFSVITAGHRITDLGTEFLVRNDKGIVDVALIKGSAQLRSEAPGSSETTLALWDEAIATPQSTVITRKTMAQLSDELAWRQGILVFRKTRLSDAVREFNRYNDTRLVVGDPSIANLTFSAEIKTGRYDDFLRLAQSVLNLHVIHDGNTISIFPATRESPKKPRN